MMVKLKVYNVGHGDTILFRLNNGQLVIRDFGRSRQASNTITSISINEILQRYQNPFSAINPEIDVILSHAHEDHFNGFYELYKRGYRKIFKNTYIPYLDFSTIQSLGAKVLTLSCYLYTYFGVNTIIGNNVKNWILSVPVLAELSKSVYGVCSGFEIKSWNPLGKILWPPSPNFPTTYYNDINDSINNQILEFGSNYEDAVYLDYKERIIDHIYRLIAPLLNPNPNESKITDENSVVDEISNILESSLTFRNYFRSNTRTHKIIFGYKRLIDDHSIVFQINDENTFHALFLSDLHEKYIGEMTALHLKCPIHYKIIKSSHHGSRYSKMLKSLKVSSDRVIHCCGPSNRSIIQPDKRYNNLSSRIICTDWNKQYSSKWQQPCPYRTFTRQSKIFIL